MSGGVFPSLVLFLAVVVAAVPWVLPAEASFILPLFLIIVIFLLSLLKRRSLPGLSVFAAGVLMDILTAGPLGYWAILFLLTFTIAVQYRSRAARPNFTSLWLAFSGTALLAAAAGWALASLYFVRIIDWWPMAIGGVVAIALFPLVAWPLRHPLGLSTPHRFAR